MDMSISAILNKRNRRDLEFFASDEFVVTLTVYATDTENLTPSDLSASTLTMKVYNDPKPLVQGLFYHNETTERPEFTIEGVEGVSSTTFTFDSADTED
jgi:hypothetical protein